MEPLQIWAEGKRFEVFRSTVLAWVDRLPEPFYAVFRCAQEEDAFEMLLTSRRGLLMWMDIGVGQRVVANYQLDVYRDPTPELRQQLRAAQDKRMQDLIDESES